MESGLRKCELRLNKPESLGYHHWLARPVEERLRDLTAWAAPFIPLRHAITLILKLLRDSGRSQTGIAQNGQFQQMTTGKTYHLARLKVAGDEPVVPELSARQHIYTLACAQSSRTVAVSTTTGNDCVDTDRRCATFWIGITPTLVASMATSAPEIFARHPAYRIARAIWFKSRPSGFFKRWALQMRRLS